MERNGGGCPIGEGVVTIGGKVSATGRDFFLDFVPLFVLRWDCMQRIGCQNQGGILGDIISYLGFG